ncbi:MAG: hypothetical protein OER91_04025 [Gammaproteobacteria bacterium]|nr:hypothetical protein [Gammaproteobacteria bacterium]
MNLKLICFSFLSILLLAGCNATTTTKADDAAAAAPEQVNEPEKDTAEAEAVEVAEVTEGQELDPNEEICKRIRKTGTRQRSKVCATRREWELSAERAKEETEKMQRRPQHGKEF